MDEDAPTGVGVSGEVPTARPEELDDFEIGSEPRCEVCGTVMRTVDGGYQCGGCGWEIDIPWIERPAAGDDLPGIRGG